MILIVKRQMLPTVVAAITPTVQRLESSVNGVGLPLQRDPLPIT